MNTNHTPSTKAPPLPAIIAQLAVAGLLTLYCAYLMLAGPSGGSLITSNFGDVLGMMALGPAITSLVLAALAAFCQRAIAQNTARSALVTATAALNAILHLPALTLAILLLITNGRFKADPLTLLSTFASLTSALALINAFFLWRARRQAPKAHKNGS